MFHLLLTLLMVVTPGASPAATPAAASPFTLCKSTYALCTTAECTAVPGHPTQLSCACKVRTGYSAATKACTPVQSTPQGQVVQSRYYPIKGYQTCSNNRPWALCLDAPCVVDRNDPKKATCTCTSVANKGTYAYVSRYGSSYDELLCSTGIISSATIKQIEQITNFLKSQNLLPPSPMTVATPPR
jgi:hypothetical protein